MKIIISFAVIAICFCCDKAISQSQPYHPVFNHVYLSVRNIDSSLKFYTKAFDLKVTDKFTQLEITQGDSIYTRPVNVIFLKFTGQDFVFELAERPAKNDTTKYGNLFQHVGVEVKDIKTALDKVISAGGIVAVPIRLVKTNSGLAIKQSYIKGPDGETIELTEIVSGGY